MTNNNERNGWNYGVWFFLIGVIVGLIMMTFSIYNGLNDYTEFCERTIEESFFNGTCLMYGKVNGFLECMNSEVFYDESNWNVTCAIEYNERNSNLLSKINEDCRWWEHK